eukprot:NODE_1463_length_538_cov_78.263804_g1386_i0.p2 GENE.NODE_1463_length_538_cov_78.263804_g1386_i0~~NODE_1463_length_538_cov_78.263804_g1386_i0.p2  ORF type:complete len:166 (+),score=48.61 NODE_1463_length_538_cov_78.263804_g1386_i0:30-527(+)
MGGSHGNTSQFTDGWPTVLQVLMPANDETWNNGEWNWRMMEVPIIPPSFPLFMCLVEFKATKARKKYMALQYFAPHQHVVVEGENGEIDVCAVVDAWPATQGGNRGYGGQYAHILLQYSSTQKPLCVLRLANSTDIIQINKRRQQRQQQQQQQQQHLQQPHMINS